MMFSHGQDTWTCAQAMWGSQACPWASSTTVCSKYVPSYVGGDRYQVECGPSSQYVEDLVKNSCSYRNWDLTGIHCMHAMVVIHLKDEFPETYVQTWYTKQTQLAIYSNFIRPVRETHCQYCLLH
ncbi:hypothetical protein J1N35_038444 [Gossypium stocksii]|uniref:SWIM-type domain-containing protein n=1 Tax=Gossypium stocksii TaxID=47602 RepID=A0A9D3ZMW1_9ROSI|nr:hypothetical protein J1N35_038444 [Gossypium stocksii]